MTDLSNVPSTGRSTSHAYANPWDFITAKPRKFMADFAKPVIECRKELERSFKGYSDEAVRQHRRLTDKQVLSLAKRHGKRICSAAALCHHGLDPVAAAYRRFHELTKSGYALAPIDVRLIVFAAVAHVR